MHFHTYGFIFFQVVAQNKLEIEIKILISFDLIFLYK